MIANRHNHLPYSELLDGETFPDTPFPSDEELVSDLVDEQLNIFYNKHDDPIKTPFGVEGQEPIDDLLVPTEELVEIEFDVGAISTTPFFMELKSIYPFLEAIPNGIHDPRKDLKIVKLSGLIHLAYTAIPDDIDLKSLTMNIRETLDPNSSPYPLVEVQILENHVLDHPIQLNNTNMVYMREDGIIKLAGNPHTLENYLVGRAIALQSIARVLLGRALKGIISHSVD